jgi:hypothetical protein
MVDRGCCPAFTGGNGGVMEILCNFKILTEVFKGYGGFLYEIFVKGARPIPRKARNSRVA